MLTGHGALRYGTSMWAVMWSCAAMAVDSTLSWLYRSQYVALVAPTSCFGVAVMSESEYMQKVPQEKLLLVIRATFFPKSAKQPNVRKIVYSKRCCLRNHLIEIRLAVLGPISPPILEIRAGALLER